MVLALHPEYPGADSAPVISPAQVAKDAGLRYVSDLKPGIQRKRAGKHFSYVDVHGQTIRDEAILKHIKSLAIPPAWTNVWICPSERGHIQATGRDARGRKQYRYHPQWRATRDETKFHRMLAFAEALPLIRERVDHDLALPKLSRSRVLAALVRLLETTHIRVGNEQYARQNESYGLTTMREQHVEVEGSTVEFQFKGKSGVEHDISVKDPRLARVVKRLRDLPGQHLFQFVDEDGALQAVHSDDVNAYLHEIAGHEFTAKDFRTWAGTVSAALQLAGREFDTQTEAKKNIVQAVEEVAHELGNTPSVCRKCYIHPEIIAAYLEGQTVQSVRLSEGAERSNQHSLTPDEQAVLMLLRERLDERDKLAPTG